MPPPAAISEATRRAFADGCRLFDAGRFFEAHEEWEAAWHLETGEVRHLLQGLIQVAAGFHKGITQGRPSGMVTLLSKGLERIDAASELGLLDSSGFREDLARWLRAAQRWAAHGERPDLPLPRLGRGG